MKQNCNLSKKQNKKNNFTIHKVYKYENLKKKWVKNIEYKLLKLCWLYM